MIEDASDPEPEKLFEFNRRKRSRWPLFTGLAALLLLLIVWPSLAGFYTTLMWFQNLGFQSVFTTMLKTRTMLGTGTGALVVLVVWLNLRLALRLSPHTPRVRENFFTIEGERVVAPDFGGLVSKLARPAAVVAGIFVGLVASGEWETWLRFRHQVPFGEADPIFGRDIGFYFFTLPVLESLARLLLALVVISLIGAAVIYLGRTLTSLGEVAGKVIAQRAALGLARGPRAHLLGLGAALFLVFAFEAWLARPNLLFSGGSLVAGASYADVNATLPLLQAQAIVAGLVAIFAVACIFSEKSRLLWGGLALYGLVLVAGWIYPSIVQRFSVAPNELAKETPYITYNIAATRKAFGLDTVEERQLPGENTLTARDIQENQRTIKNIRLWDQDPLLSTFKQLQEFRTYYDFQSVDNDRYHLNGEAQQVMLSARELSSDRLPNRNWINEHLTFTHGYGVTLGPVSKVIAGGLPELYIKDIPPASSIPSLKIERPEIYFGELSNEHVYVKTNEPEFNYPSGEKNVYSNYEGNGGVPIGSLWQQLLFATRFADLKLLLSNYLTPESRVLFHRNIRERLENVAPFLTFDRDPYLVIHEGRLFWIVDAYTTGDHYPYSQPLSDGSNYWRNSVKAVVDAYHGDVKLYIADERDPVIQTYARIFPGALRPLGEMPAGLREHLRYPEDIFRIQTAVYSTYQMNQPQVFYNKEDQWETASVPEGKGANAKDKQMDPYYTIMKLPDGKTEEFLLMLPFVPKGKSNLSAWMVARADGENYGKMLVYRFPKQKQIYGPKQVIGLINQDPEISRQLTLWDQRGSQVIFGPLMVIPIKESLIYVQPLYLQAENGKIPELREVIVVAENRTAMEPTLDASLAKIFGASATPAASAGATTLAQAQPATAPNQTATQPAAPAQSLSAQAKQHYDLAIKAQREGDWARYGEELKQLGAVLEQMSKTK
ncbi:MAG TPA: UPF0182 family protein [Blastocatellia bacterium]|nr:UPF0182 family protein [Blastocatellia bacterium]